MLLAEQVPEHGKDPIDRSQIKEKDYRGQKWPHDYKSELEALPIPERLEILRARLDELVDHDLLRAVREQGEVERGEIMAAVRRALAGE
jgi:hypothetical protein